MTAKVNLNFLEIYKTNYDCGCILRQYNEWRHSQFCAQHISKRRLPLYWKSNTIKFSPQREFFHLTARNQCFSGGFGNGKTYVGCQKLVYLLCNFPKARAFIVRNRAKDLENTTKVTFFKFCPPELYAEQNGGSYNRTRNELIFSNGSSINFMHFDDFSESSLKSLEGNFLLIDQAEEISEAMFLLLNSRIGRWDGAIVPPELLLPDNNWPPGFNPVTGLPRVPSYTMVLVNPDVKTSWIYRRFHPESTEFIERWSKKNYAPMVQASTRDNPTIDPELLEDMLSRDPVWVAKYVDGVWGISQGQVHIISKESRLYVTKGFVENLLKKSRLYRVLDHGESAPTCCLWIAAYGGLHFVYREYYQPEKPISYHREIIQDLSGREKYVANFADPSIFKKEPTKKGGRFTVAYEYLDTENCKADQIVWSPADNNEFSTRNRINELLRNHPDIVHPVTGQKDAPKLYFIMKDAENPNGCYFSVLQTESQKRIQVGTENGFPQFSDERDDNVPDHAYDPVRYYVSMHTQNAKERPMKAPAGSFSATLELAKKWNRDYDELYV